MNKPKLWEGQDLEGEWLITLKLDGVRALRTEEGVISRKDKPLYNLDHLDFTDAEIYLGSWEKTVSAVRTKNEVQNINQSHVYSLEPLDERLILGTLVNPTANAIQLTMQGVLTLGYEGVVLRQGDKWLKVKPHETHDVKVLGTYPGKGKHTGRIGGVVTEFGKVGTGFLDQERIDGFEIGETIEVACMGFTSKGKFRHARFVRRRFDK